MAGTSLGAYSAIILTKSHCKTEPNGPKYSCSEYLHPKVPLLVHLAAVIAKLSDPWTPGLGCRL